MQAAKTLLLYKITAPALKAKKDGKPVQWFVAEGKINDKEAMQPVYKKIEETLDKKPPVVQATLNFIKEL